MIIITYSKTCFKAQIPLDNLFIHENQFHIRVNQGKPLLTSNQKQYNFHIISSDLTFITNEKDKNLSDRFKVLIKDTKFFDVLVYKLYGLTPACPELTEWEEIKIVEDTTK